LGLEAVSELSQAGFRGAPLERPKKNPDELVQRGIRRRTELIAAHVGGTCSPATSPVVREHNSS